jgi:hypothetical protein
VLMCFGMWVGVALGIAVADLTLTTIFPIISKKRLTASLPAEG